MDLVQTLISQLGVNAQQAQAGVGALLKLTKTQVSAATFADIGKLLPQADDWMAAVPASSGLGGMLGGMLGGKLGSLATITSQFQALGIDAQKLAPFAKLALAFLQTNLTGEARAEVDRLVNQFLRQ